MYHNKNPQNLFKTKEAQLEITALHNLIPILIPHRKLEAEEPLNQKMINNNNNNNSKTKKMMKVFAPSFDLTIDFIFKFKS